jgi:hypothetical protein
VTTATFAAGGSVVKDAAGGTAAGGADDPACGASVVVASPLDGVLVGAEGRVDGSTGERQNLCTVSASAAPTPIAATVRTAVFRLREGAFVSALDDLEVLLGAEDLLEGRMGDFESRPPEASAPDDGAGASGKSGTVLGSAFGAGVEGASFSMGDGSG